MNNIICLYSESDHNRLYILVTDEELKILKEANKKYGSIYDAANKDENISNLLTELLNNREEQEFNSFCYYE